MAPSLPSAQVDLKDNVVTAKLPSGDSCTVYLYGATVTSWTTADNHERMFLSTAAVLDGSKPIRGGIPIVFPVFGPPPKDHATSKLPQHGFARNSLWEFLGKSTSESLSSKSDESVKLDFGLSSTMLSDDMKSKWPYEFGLVYSVTLGKQRLEVQLHVQNKDSKAFDFHCLFHSYFTCKDIHSTTITGLEGASYVDKMRSAKTFTEDTPAIKFTAETDRVYSTPPKNLNDTKDLPQISVNESGQDTLICTRDALPDCTIWNGWKDKIAGMGDFEPKDGWERYVCVEPGVVDKWVKLEAGDAWEGGAVFEVPKL